MDYSTSYKKTDGQNKNGHDCTDRSVSSCLARAAAEAFAVSPPPANRGAQTPEGGLLIDWCSFTVPDGTPVESFVLPWLGDGFGEVEEGGRYGYTKAWRRGHVTVSAAGRDGMGVHVEASGQGCRELEQLGVVKTWPEFFADVLAVNGKFSRLDSALDETEGCLELELIRAAAEQGNIVTRYRAPVRCTWGHDAEGGQLTGRTVNFGSGKSNSQVRMYDKALERKAKGLPVNGPHVRVELQQRDQRAHKMATDYSTTSQPAALLAGVLRGLIDFKERGEQIQRYKWDTVLWWGTFLNWACRVRLVIAPVLRTVNRVFNWVSKQVAPSLAVLSEAFTGDYSWLRTLLDEGEQRLGPLHRQMLEKFRLDQLELSNVSFNVVTPGT